MIINYVCFTIRAVTSLLKVKKEINNKIIYAIFQYSMFFQCK